MAKEKEDGKYSVGTVATATAPAVIGPDGQIMTEQELLVLIANDVAELKKKLVG